MLNQASALLLCQCPDKYWANEIVEGPTGGRTFHYASSEFCLDVRALRLCWSGPRQPEPTLCWLGLRIASHIVAEYDRFCNFLHGTALLAALALNGEISLLFIQAEITLQNAFRPLDHLAGF